MFGRSSSKRNNFHDSFRRLLRVEQLDQRLLLTVTTLENVATVDASEADNQIELTLGSDQHQLTIDGELHEFDAAVIDRILILGNDGNDSVTVHGTAEDDRIDALDQHTTIRSDNYLARVSGSETIVINAGDGNDRAKIIDSESDDTVELRHDQALINRGTTHTVLITGQERTEAFAQLGGTDVANFIDSPGDDRFVSKHERSFMSSTDYLNYARGFDEVNAESTVGGTDEAKMFDSPGDDVLTVAGTTVIYEIDGSTNTSKGFSKSRSFSSEGADRASAFGSHFVTDHFVWDADSAFMYSTGTYDSTAPPLFVGETTDSFVNVMIGFPKITANGSDPSDRAELRGTAGDDTFVGAEDKATMQTDLGDVAANGFGLVRAFGNRGDDYAYLEDSVGDDKYVGRSRFGYMTGNGYLNYANGFSIDAVSKNGGIDRALTWSYSGPGRDYLTVNEDRLLVFGPSRSERMIGFADAQATGENAGLVVVAPYTSTLRLLGSHDETDTPSEAVSPLMESRINELIPESVVNEDEIELAAGSSRRPR